MNVPLFDLNFGEQEEKAVIATLRSKWISTGPVTEKFEKQFAAMHGVKHGVALSNCTAGLHLALRILGVGPGDEVIVPSLTFVATVNSVLMVGATPVFADVESLEDWTISPADVRRKINPNTKAIITMHYGGYGANMPAICQLAKDSGLYVVEDACHAPLGRFGDRLLGGFGDISCYSFYSNKNMTTGEGGMLITDNPEYDRRARWLRSHGMTATAYDRERGKEFYDVVEYGYNYRLDDIRASIGLVQLQKLEQDIQRRAELTRRYRENLSACPQVKIPFSAYAGQSSNYILPVLSEGWNRPQVREALKKAGIATTMHYPPAHLFDYFADHRCSLPLTELIGRYEISLPLYYSLTFDQVDYVCETLAACIKD